MGLVTQQDPIGIAGGLNLYGYANGDPVNFSDPFGLCPEEKRDEDGRCPGGLAVDEWDAVVEAASALKEMAARQVLDKLEAGEIQGFSDPRSSAPPAKVGLFSPDVIQVNRTMPLGVPGMNASAFGTSILPDILAHELRHTQQGEHFGFWMRLMTLGTPLLNSLEREAVGWAQLNRRLGQGR